LWWGLNDSDISDRSIWVKWRWYTRGRRKEEEVEEVYSCEIWGIFSAAVHSVAFAIDGDMSTGS